jgi:hypothetical protein
MNNMASIYKFQDYLRPQRAVKENPIERLINRPGYIFVGYYLDRFGFFNIYWMAETGPYRVLNCYGDLSQGTLKVYSEKYAGRVATAERLFNPTEHMTTVVVTQAGREILVNPKRRAEIITGGLSPSGLGLKEKEDGQP